MDKPISMSVKDYLIRVMSVRTNTPVKIIEAIVVHQMDGLNKAIQADIIFSAEMSGFGKFLFNHRKAKKKMDKNISKEQTFINILNRSELTEKQIISNTLKLENTRKWMDGIKPKLDKCPKLQNM